MKKNVLRMEVSGIKCDNPRCDYADMGVKLEDYDEWVNKPCPKCGDILLTDVDYANVKFLSEMTAMINETSPDIDSSSEEEVVMKVNMDGTGALDFQILKNDVINKD